MSIFLLVYLLFLNTDASFRVHRRFLLAGIITSFVLPAVEITRIVVGAPVGDIAFSTSVSEGIIAPQSEISFNWWLILGCIYFAGVAILFIRFLLQIFSLARFLQKYSKTRKNNLIHIKVKEDLRPFSFFKYFVFNPQLHDRSELKMILQHENIHAQQWHSIDVIIATLATIALWFNPLSWFYKKNLLQNLEYIADEETVAVSASVKEYQKALVRVSVGNFQPALTNHFYQSFLKKRIKMLNKKKTTTNSSWKTSIIFPFILAFILCFQIKTEAQVAGKNTSEESKFKIRQTTLSANEINASESSANRPKGESVAAFQENQNPPLYLVDGEIKDKKFVDALQPENIASINVLKGASAIIKYGNKAKNGAVEIFLKTNADEIPVDAREQPGGKSKNFNHNSISPEPLYVLDGKPLAKNFDLEIINPKEIDSIVVLKDEKSIKKYGEKGKHGVVKIYTKK